MSSESSLESALRNIYLGFYGAVIIMVIVCYDYVLTFSREIDSIWCRPWTRVSVLFVIVRYVGLCWTITLALTGTAFVPGPIKIGVRVALTGLSAGVKFGYYFKGTAILMVGDWGYILFLAAADLVMILRVYAMWDQSKIILGILLSLYVPQIVLSIVWEGVYTNPSSTISVTVVQVLNFKHCGYSSSTSPSATYRAIPRFLLGAALLILAIIPTLRQSIDMYRLTKRWQTNRSMKLLLREGAVYFVVNLLFNIVNAIQLPVVDLMLFLDAFTYSLSCAIMPRFIIDIRELYDRDLENRWQGIDTGFGLLPDDTLVAGEAVMSGESGPEAIELEALGDGTRSV